jgi:hypothetical protein
MKIRPPAAWAAGRGLWARFRPGDRLRAVLADATTGISPPVGRRRGALVHRLSAWARGLRPRRFRGKRNPHRSAGRGFPAEWH